MAGTPVGAGLHAGRVDNDARCHDRIRDSQLDKSRDGVRGEHELKTKFAG